MKVIRVNDFDIPSDENDYDELVAFADTMASIEQFEAIPKSDYENRLKADMVAILENLQKEFKELYPNPELNTYYRAVDDCSNLTQQKINVLKAEINLQDS